MASDCGSAEDLSHVTLSELVQYAVHWNSEGGVAIDDTKTTNELLHLVETVFERDSPDGNTSVPLDEGVLLLAELSIPVSIEELSDHLKTCLQKASTTNASEAEDTDLATFLDWAGDSLTSSKEILDFCEKRGARVEIVNSAAKLMGANGVCVPRIQSVHKSAWNTKSGDWKNVMVQLWKVGLRKNIEDSSSQVQMVQQ